MKQYRSWAGLAVALLWLATAAGCGQAVGGSAREGRVMISVAASEALGAQGGGAQPELVPESYLFSGSGPAGQQFSLSSADGSVTVQHLASGEWSIVVEALNRDQAVVLAGQTVVLVAPFESLTVDIALEPLPGSGALQVSALWDKELTVEPQATVTLRCPSGATQTHTLAPTADGGAAHTIGQLPAGPYRVSVELLDKGQPVAGKAVALRVLHGLTVSAAARFEDLNKVGRAVPVAAESFTLAWDAPAGHSPAHYRLYYRGRGQYHWMPLQEIAAQAEPQFTVTRDVLDFGIWELAVSAIATDGTESALHSSMADDAQPVSGWYVQWSGP